MDEIIDFIVFCHITRIVGAIPGRDQFVKVFHSPNVIIWDIFDIVSHQLILDHIDANSPLLIVQLGHWH